MNTLLWTLATFFGNKAYVISNFDVASFSYSAAFMVLSLLRYDFDSDFNLIDIVMIRIPILVYISLFQLWCSLAPLIVDKTHQPLLTIS